MVLNICGFHENQPRGGLTFTSICVYHTTVWHFESKECLGKVCVHVLEYTVCNFVYFYFQFSLKTLVTALIIVTLDGYEYMFQEFVNGGISENSGILMDYFSHDSMDWTIIVVS